MYNKIILNVAVFSDGAYFWVLVVLFFVVCVVTEDTLSHPLFLIPKVEFCLHVRNLNILMCW